MAFSLLMGAALKGTVVLGAAWLVALVLRRHSAAARHLVWTAAAAALVALPFLTAAVPALRVSAPPAMASGVFFRAITVATALGTARGPSHAATPLWRPDARYWISAVWFAGTAIALLQMLLGYQRLRSIRRRSKPFGAGEANGVPVLETAPGAMPVTFGVRHPVILMPADAAQWTEERRRVVLLHELAHIRRGDAATHLLARAALSLYWWNPLAWLAWREFLKERERAADDLVLNAGERASEYARHLLEVARGLRPASAVAWAAVPMARSSQLESRLLAILDSGANRSTVARAAPLAAALLAVAAMAPFAAIRAQDTAPHVLATDAAGLVKLGDLAVQRHQPEEAAGYYTKAVSFGDRPEVVSALIFLGLAEFRNRNYDAAYDWFQRALNADPNGPQAGRGLMWMAAARARQPERAPDANSLYLQALAKTEGDSLDSANAMLMYAQFLREQGRTEEANEYAAKARENTQRRLDSQVTLGVSGIKMGPGVTAPKLIHKLEPEYTQEARVAAYQGTVLLSVDITPDGRANNIRVQRALGLGLDEKAIEAIEQWQFEPGMIGGQPVTVTANIEVNFRLK